MSEKIIGSLIYGQHVAPKKGKAWKDRLKVPAAIAAVLIVIGGLAYQFANFREERRVRQFLSAIENRRYEEAFQIWDADSHYTFNDFLEDWGDKGYYSEGMKQPEIVDSNGHGGAVIVYIGIETFKEPVALLVNKETLRLSFSPTNKYTQ